MDVAQDISVLVARKGERHRKGSKVSFSVIGTGTPGNPAVEARLPDSSGAAWPLRGSYSLTECWHTARDRAKLGRLRLHDLRHTVASHAVMSGENLPQVGKLLGHRRHRTTAGYAHLADGHLVETAERVGKLIAEAMAGQVTSD